MMKFRSKSIGGLALAVASITALAACSSSSSSSSGGGTPPQAPSRSRAGSARCRWPRPAARGQAGTITWAMQPGAAPNWILPVVPGAANSVFNNFTFDLGDVAAAVLDGERGRPEFTRP